MKRVAMISFHTCPLERLGMFDAGGMNVYLTNLSLSLMDLGWKVDIFTRNHKQLHRDNSKENNLHIIHLPVATDEGIIKDQLINHSKEFAKEIIRYLRQKEKKYDLFHAHYFLSGITALELKETLNLPVIQTFHTLAKLKEIHGEEMNEKRLSKEYKIVKEIDHIIVSTDLECQDLLTYYKAERKKISIVPPGIDTNIFRPRDKKKARRKLSLDFNRPIILFVGRIHPIKGISTLIEALALLRRNYPQYREKFCLLLVGGDIDNRTFWLKEEVKRIQQLIRDRDLQCSTHFVGAVENEKLPDYYSAADVVVLPSLYESFGLVVLEAMATGCPVIASSVGGLRFMINDGKNGLLFPRQNAGILAKKMLQLLNDEQLRINLGKNAQNYARKFSWKKQTRLISDIYQKVIKNSFLK